MIRLQNTWIYHSRLPFAVLLIFLSGFYALVSIHQLWSPMFFLGFGALLGYGAALSSIAYYTSIPAPKITASRILMSILSLIVVLGLLMAFAQVPVPDGLIGLYQIFKYAVVCWVAYALVPLVLPKADVVGEDVVE